MECTLGGSGTTITGNGTQHREAGTDLTFSVSGSPSAGVSLAYASGTTESFSFVQPDSNHITLTNTDRKVDLVRQ